MIDFFNISLGEGIGCACRRCSPPTPEHFREVDAILEEVSRAVALWDGVGPGPNIAFTGPEPYRHRRLPTLAQGAMAAGVQRLSLSTDAVALAMPDTAAGSLDAGVRHIEVPLLGASSHSHDALSGTPGSFDGALAGMRTLKSVGEERGVPVLICGRVRVCSHNVRELPGIVIAFAQVGANSVTLELDGTVPATVARPWVGAAVDTGIVSNVWVALEGATAEEYRIAPLHEHNATRLLPSSGEGAA